MNQQNTKKMRTISNVRGLPDESDDSMIARALAFLAKDNGVPMRLVKAAPYRYRGENFIKICAEPEGA